MTHTLSLEQLHALQNVAHTATFALAAQTGLVEEPHNERQQDVARDAQKAAVDSAVAALNLGISGEQVNRIASDAFRELIARWSDSRFMRGAAERATAIVREGFEIQ